jgi:hypothetical protein
MRSQAQAQRGGDSKNHPSLSESSIPTVSSWEPFNNESDGGGDFLENNSNDNDNNNNINSNVTTNNNNDNHQGREKTSQLGLLAAQSLLQKLQHQLLYGDSPPGNELHHLHQHHRAHHASAQEQEAKQQQQQTLQQQAPTPTHYNGKLSTRPYVSRQRHDTSQSQSLLSATTCAVLQQVLEQRGWSRQHINHSLNKPSCLSLSQSQSRSIDGDGDDDDEHGIAIQQSRSSTSGNASDPHADNLSVDDSVSGFVETLLIGPSSPVHPSSHSAAASVGITSVLSGTDVNVTMTPTRKNVEIITNANANADATPRNGVSRRLFSPSKQQKGAEEAKPLLVADDDDIAGGGYSSSCIAKFDPTPEAHHGAYLQFDPNNAETKTSPSKQQKQQQSQHTPRDHAYFVQKQLHQKAVELKRDLINPHKSIQVMGHDSLVKWMQDVSVQQEQFEHQQQQLEQQQQQHQEEASQKSQSSRRSERHSKSKAPATSPDDFLKRMIPSPRDHAASFGLFPSTSHESPSNHNPYSPHSPNHRQGPMLVPTYASVSSYDLSSSESESQSESENEADAESDADYDNYRGASLDGGQGPGANALPDTSAVSTAITPSAAVPEQRAVTPRNHQHVGLMQQHQQLTTATPATPTLQQ